MSERKRIAVIGGGVAGIAASYLLSRKYSVSLFEGNDYLGGHTNTDVIPDGPDSGTPIDTGFIVCNPTNYENFYRLLDEWGVARRDSNMSFGFYCEQSGLAYTGPALHEFILQPGNFLKPQFLKMLLDQRRFNLRALRDLESGAIHEQTLGSYLEQLGVGSYFIENYLVPLAASIWSSPDMDIRDFPAATFVTFFRNHGMLELRKRPRWQTIVGGSHSYVRAFLRLFPGALHLNCPVQWIRRVENGAVCLRFQDGREESFDAVILACHADQSFALLEDPSDEERALLGSWRYQKNWMQLHSDEQVMPPSQRVWASWNYIRERERAAQEPVSITYYMNRLQGLKTDKNYFVTLNRQHAVREEFVEHEREYTHPVYGPDVSLNQERLAQLSGERNTFYCGSYMRYGFHEDAVLSAVWAARKLGVEW